VAATLAGVPEPAISTLWKITYWSTQVCAHVCWWACASVCVCVCCWARARACACVCVSAGGFCGGCVPAWWCTTLPVSRDAVAGCS
jgi:hypothetical protein